MRSIRPRAGSAAPAWQEKPPGKPRASVGRVAQTPTQRGGEVHPQGVLTLRFLMKRCCLGSFSVILASFKPSSRRVSPVLETENLKG